MIYLGTLGRMIGIKCPASQQVSIDGEPSFQTTLGGRRIGQVPPGVGRRAWQHQLSDASTPEQISLIMAFVNGEWGNGPFVFVSADAPVTNLMSPDAASCEPSDYIRGSGAVVSTGGPMETADGWAGRSYRNSGTGPIFFGRNLIPVLPGIPVTASAYAMGEGGAVGLAWYKADGAYMATSMSSVLSAGGTTVRSHVTALPPAGAVSCRPLVNANAKQACRPAVTWTDQAFDWADGQGCPKAVIHGASRDIVMASRDPRGGRYSNLSFTITEVG